MTQTAETVVCEYCASGGERGLKAGGACVMCGVGRMPPAPSIGRTPSRFVDGQEVPGEDYVMEEWEAQYRAGLVPQKPARRAR